METFMKFDWHYSVKQWLTLPNFMTPSLSDLEFQALLTSWCGFNYLKTANFGRGEVVFELRLYFFKISFWLGFYYFFNGVRFYSRVGLHLRGYGSRKQSLWTTLLFLVVSMLKGVSVLFLNPLGIFTLLLSLSSIFVVGLSQVPFTLYRLSMLRKWRLDG